MKKEPNIVVFTNTLLAGGAEKQALLLTTALQVTNNVLLVIYYGNHVEKTFYDIIQKEKINVIYLTGNHLSKLLKFYSLLKDNNISVIFSYLLTTNLIGAVIGRLAGVKMRVGGIRNASLDAKKLLVQRFINNHLNTHTIFNNYTGLRELKEKGFNDKNALVISNGLAVNTFPINRAPKELVNIITVGRFVPQKNYFEALKAMQILWRSGIKFKYTIIGYGELESEIRKAVISMGLEQCVEIIIKPAHIDLHYQAADIYLCTSLFEGLSNTVMEAMSFSLPIVATLVGDNDKLVNDGANGFIVDNFDPVSFVVPLEKLISSANLRNEMGLQSFKMIKEGYSVEAFTQQYQNFLSGSKQTVQTPSA